MPRRVVGPVSGTASQSGRELRYRFVKGLVLPYGSTLSVYRVSDAGPRFLTRSAEQLEAQVRLKLLERDDDDGGFCVLSYFRPLRRLVDGREAPAGEPAVTYFKHDARGQVIESSDPATATATLLLPEGPVGQGCEWRLVQQYAPPGRSEPMELACRYGVDAMEESRARLSYVVEEVRYEADLPECEGFIYTMAGRGTYEFDWEQGVLVGLQTESRMTSKQDDLLLEVVTVQSLVLQA